MQAENSCVLHARDSRMHKDLKMGLISGMVIVVGAALYLGTRPSLSSSRLRGGSTADTSQQHSGPVKFISKAGPNTPIGDRPEPNVFDWTRFEAEENRQSEKYYILRKNETLSDVARHYYGSPGDWRKIYNANRDTIVDPDKVRPGTKLIIPD
ncbi:MAG: LysM peptidoglycan-binding domain-containing protein [Sedimentisphaerales bacterium]|nr:LysM peptidoglycan-binding domain-containing protein [Sedimentisphaerales bacterium]